MNVKQHSMQTVWVDPDDAPELNDEFFENADFFDGEKLIRRGRPKLTITKEPIKLRLDADVLAALRATGTGWQTRINDTLRASLHLAGRI